MLIDWKPVLGETVVPILPNKALIAVQADGDGIMWTPRELARSHDGTVTLGTRGVFGFAHYAWMDWNEPEATQ